MVMGVLFIGSKCVVTTTDFQLVNRETNCCPTIGWDKIIKTDAYNDVN